MAELTQKQIEKAYAELNQIAERRGVVIDQHTDAKAAVAAAEEVGQRNFTALGVNECAEFFPTEEYIKKADTLTHTTTSDNGFKSLYALVNRFRIVKAGGKTKKIGEHPSFIDVGRLVQRHYNVDGLEKTAEGTIPGAVSVVTPGKFNEELNSYNLPWAMLTEYLGGKTIQATRSEKREMFQHFENSRPVKDKYDFRNCMEIGFIPNVK